MAILERMTNGLRLFVFIFYFSIVVGRLCAVDRYINLLQRPDGHLAAGLLNEFVHN